MDELNNSESEIFQQILEKQTKYINDRIISIKNKYLDDRMGCCGEKKVIAKHLNNGPAQNLIQTFFNFKATKCILCKRKKVKIIYDNLKYFKRWFHKFELI